MVGMWYVVVWGIWLPAGIRSIKQLANELVGQPVSQRLQPRNEDSRERMSVNDPPGRGG